MKWLKRIVIFILILLVVGVVAFFIVNESRPKGISGKAADEVATKMQHAVNLEAWKNTGAIKFTFSGLGKSRTTLWDKKRHYAWVKWSNYEAWVNINQRKGIVKQGGQLISGEAGQKLVIKAWKIWVNDAFWLNPIAKAFDPGTTRSLVDLGNNKQGLLVSYNSGGATPGDAYLWLLDQNNLPTDWKLWVSIIPLGGVKFSWENWKTLSTGAKVSTFHDGLIDIKLTDVKAGKDLLEITDNKDIFAPLEKAVKP